MSTQRILGILVFPLFPLVMLFGQCSLSDTWYGWRKTFWD